MPGTILFKPIQARFEVTDRDKSILPAFQVKIGSKKTDEQLFGPYWDWDVPIALENVNDDKGKLIFKDDHKGSECLRAVFNIHDFASNEPLPKWVDIKNKEGKVKGQVLIEIRHKEPDILIPNQDHLSQSTKSAYKSHLDSSQKSLERRDVNISTRDTIDDLAKPIVTEEKINEKDRSLGTGLVRDLWEDRAQAMTSESKEILRDKS